MTKPSRNVLLCEDDVEVADSLAHILRMHGEAVTVTHDAETALRCAAREIFDVAFLDILLPGMNGVDCYVEMKSRNLVAVIHLMTGYAGADLIKRAHAEGARDILRKPTHPREILARLPG